MNTEDRLYEDFQNWLDACPVVITDYQDFTDEFIVKFNLRAE